MAVAFGMRQTWPVQANFSLQQLPVGRTNMPRGPFKQETENRNRGSKLWQLKEHARLPSAPTWAGSVISET